MATWLDENETKKQKYTAELFGRLYAEAAVQKHAAEDEGYGFGICEQSMFPGKEHKEKEFQQLKSILGSPDCAMVEESESLKEFSRLFGYVIKIEKVMLYDSSVRHYKSYQTAKFSPAF